MALGFDTQPPNHNTMAVNSGVVGHAGTKAIVRTGTLP
jgi:hypothetical protein